MSGEQLDGFADAPAPDDAAKLVLPRRASRTRKPRPSKSDPEGMSGTAGQSPRYFFPCNREDALVLLSGMLISPAFFINGIRLAVQNDQIAIIDGALRKSEEELLSGDRPERFPLLMEIGPEVAGRSARDISPGEIVRLVFRTTEESEDFRFRPVDEFDTESLRSSVEPALFGGDGEVRFALRPPLDESDDDTGYVADRLAGAVHGALSLARSAPQLGPAIIDFFARNGSAEGPESLSFSIACEALHVVAADSVPTRRQSAVVAAFANDEGLGARALIQSVAGNFAATGSRSDEEARQESRWEATAHDAIRGRIAIDGDQVSDQGSILLRAALLGAIGDKPTSLLAFLAAEKPSGVRVTLQGSFLAGLKRGVLRTSWKDKSQDAPWISALLREVIAAPAGVGVRDSLVSVRTEVLNGHTTITIAVAGHDVVTLQAKSPDSEDHLTSEWLKSLASSGYEILGQGRSPHSWIVALTPDQPVEVSHAEAGDIHFPVMRYHLEEGRKFKKVKEVSAALENVGMFWHRSMDSMGSECLYCDLPALPGPDGRTVLSTKLSEAIALATVAPKTPKAKVKRPPVKRGRGKTTIAEIDESDRPLPESASTGDTPT